jgi:hypothetical protein
VRALQQRTRGFTEFVPLPFVHMEAPMYLKGRARQGPTLRETVLMHAVARLALHPVLPNIQVSWVKLGPEGVRACLTAGANDLGGTLMNESISRAAGTLHGQEMPPERMDEMIAACGRTPQQRTTLYGAAPAEQRSRSYTAEPLAPLVQTPPRKRARACEYVWSAIDLRLHLDVRKDLYHGLRFQHPTRGALANRDGVLTLAKRGEELGFNYLAIPDHIVIPRDIASPYPYNTQRKMVGASDGDCLEHWF